MFSAVDLTLLVCITLGYRAHCRASGSSAARRLHGRIHPRHRHWWGSSGANLRGEQVRVRDHSHRFARLHFAALETRMLLCLVACLTTNRRRLSQHRDSKVTPAEFSRAAESARQAVAHEHGVAVAQLRVVAQRTVPKTTSGKIARRWCKKAFTDSTLKVCGWGVKR